LKLIQARIFQLMQCIERPEWLISGQKKKSYISNGQMHQDGNYILTIDIKKFYDNCSSEFVFRFFKDKMKTAPDIADILTRIVTYGGKIPTGCPTSQLIAFFAYEDMFFEIKAIAERYGCKFSLYVDDMTFSSTNPFNEKTLARDIDRTLRRYRHKPKYKKVHYYTKSDIKPVTGTILKPDHSLEIPNKLQKCIYDGFQEVKSRYPF
ncbi:RNA-directed DNA polymerase, partial [bacterium]|nr:RNA-directed DNA polymerase [bacterium]